MPLLDELSNLPTAIGEPIIAAWNAKEDLLDLLATARTQPNRETGPRPAVPVLPALRRGRHP